jgi:hypothetical protein
VRVVIDGLPDPLQPRALAFDDEGHLWIGTRLRGVFVLSLATDPPALLASYSTRDGPPSDHVPALADRARRRAGARPAGRSGRHWRGLVRLDPATRALRVYGARTASPAAPCSTSCSRRTDGLDRDRRRLGVLDVHAARRAGARCRASTSPRSPPAAARRRRQRAARASSDGVVVSSDRRELVARFEGSRERPRAALRASARGHRPRLVRARSPARR